MIKSYCNHNKDLKVIIIRWTEKKEINKIALSSNDDNRLQIFDKITTYLYGTNAFKECESEMLISQIREWIRKLENATQATMSFVAEVIPLQLAK